MTRAVTVAAVDLGAASGRVVRARVGPGLLALDIGHRFVNRPVRVGGTLHWNVLSLWAETIDGLAGAAEIESVGVDSWAVDHGLLDASGALLGNPVHYRDGRTAAVPEQVADLLPDDEWWAVCGTQPLAFTTAYQLVAALRTPLAAGAHTMLLLPDLFGYLSLIHI